MSGRTYRTIYVYVAREFLLSFLVAFLFFFFIFFVNQLLLLAEDILAKDVPFGDVMRLLLYSLPSIVALSFPFGSLVGALMAIGRLSSDNEVIAFRASGIPQKVLFAPVVFIGLLFSVVSFVTNDYFLPLGTIRFGTLYRELLYSNPRLELESNSVVRYRDSTLITGEVEGENIEDLIIIESNDEGRRRVISADSARIDEEGPERGVLSLRLDGVFSQRSQSANNEDGYEYFSADGMIYNVLLRDITLAVRSPGPREMSSVDVYREIEEKEAELQAQRLQRIREVGRLRADLYRDYLLAAGMLAGGSRSEEALSRLGSALETLRRRETEPITDRSLRVHLVEFHKKFSIPFACLAFTVFAFPVGGMARRSGRTVGFAVGLLVAVIYWSMLIGGQTLGVQSPGFSPVLSMWAPNLVVVTFGIIVFVLRRAR